MLKKDITRSATRVRGEQAVRRDDSRMRRLARRAARRVAVVIALLILFYATSLHGVSLRTFILAALLVASLYVIFKDML